MDDLSAQFSVIIQGPILGTPGDAFENQRTKQCIESVTRVLPNAEIIISTWEGSEVSHLKYDKVIFNVDPGATTFNNINKSYYNNSNRQIVSTFNGLKNASRKYSVKLRGDCLLQHLGFTNFLNQFQKASNYSFFNHRVIVPTIFSRNPRRIPILFHPSDIFQVGLTEDLLDLWDIPLQPEPQTTRAISANRVILNDPFPKVGYRMKFAAEQYIWFAFCRKKGLNLNIKYYCHLPLSKIFKSELSIINNFIIASQDQIGVILPSKFNNDSDLYTHEEWLKLYNRYSVTGYTFADKLRLTLQVYTNNLRIVINRINGIITRRLKGFFSGKMQIKVGN